MKRRTGFNQKRMIMRNAAPDYVCRIVVAIQYGGNPEHKRNPGDFGLIPPAHPRPDKTLCDGVSIFTRTQALDMLKEGARRGLMSEQQRHGFPQNIWAVTEDGDPLEAQLENAEQGIYHGYPMPASDPFREIVLERWSQS